MYSTCLFCAASLESNAVIEPFPIGRRLAFDGAKGRLWVVCRKCERWNLTPLEERWEAIEACERRFRETPLRVSTDNIGLARVREGLELVRVGAALRPEFAAWRYGDQFGRRRRRHLLLTGTGIAAGAGIALAGPVMGLIAGSSWGLLNVANTLHNVIEERRVRVRLRVPEHAQPLLLRRRHLDGASLDASVEDESWGLRIPFGERDAWWRSVADSSSESTPRGNSSVIRLTGRAALEAAGQLLPQLNARGARRTEVQVAVRLIESAGDPMRLFFDYASGGQPPKLRSPGGGGGGGGAHHTGVLSSMSTEIRLALEMASHEEAERRAMDGELALLEAAWRQAEEIAAIADELLVPREVEERLEKPKTSSRDPSA